MFALSHAGLYQRQRVLTYWIVDPDGRFVEVWHPKDQRPEIVTDTLRRQGKGAPPLEIHVGALTEPI